MDAGPLDVLEDRDDLRVFSITECLHVDLDRALEEPVDEHRPLVVSGERGAYVLGTCADPHRAPAEHVRGADEHRVADPRRRLDGLLPGGDDLPVGAADAEALEQPSEALAILGEVDRVERRAHDPVARRLERARQPERRLAAELDHDPVRLLALAHGEHLLGAQRLEVEPVGGVVVGRNRLRVAVHHHGLVAERAEAPRRVHAAVVELDPLPDPVRAAAEDHDARLLPSGHGLVGLAPRGVEVVRARRHLPRARVDAPERREHAARAPMRTRPLLRDAASPCDVEVG